jgi:hypothetical protein
MGRPLWNVKDRNTEPSHPARFDCHWLHLLSRPGAERIVITPTWFMIWPARFKTHASSLQELEQNRLRRCLGIDVISTEQRGL